MLDQIGTAIHRITPVDTLDTIVHRRMMKKVQQAYDKSDEDVTHTAGLEKHLQLCVGCKVMLKWNTIIIIIIIINLSAACVTEL